MSSWVTPGGWPSTGSSWRGTARPRGLGATPVIRDTGCTVYTDDSEATSRPPWRSQAQRTWASCTIRRLGGCMPGGSTTERGSSTPSDLERHPSSASPCFLSGGREEGVRVSAGNGIQHRLGKCSSSPVPGSSSVLTPMCRPSCHILGLGNLGKSMEGGVHTCWAGLQIVD